MKKNALIDLASLLIIFWGAVYLKSFLPTQLQGTFIVVSTSLVALLIMKVRGIKFTDVGFRSFSLNTKFLQRVLFISFSVFVIQAIGITVLGYLLGGPDPGTAITSQPKTLLGFLLDIIFITWIVTGVGEEFIFRGIIINRLKHLFSNDTANIYFLSAIQAIWFGLGHSSQGISGIILTGLIGFFLGIYFLKQRDSGLWPLIFAHGLIDTVVLTINFVN